MKITPGIRRAAHQALDLILDALAEEQRETPTKKRRRARAEPPTLPPDVSPEELAHVGRQLARSGYVKR